MFLFPQCDVIKVFENETSNTAKNAKFYFRYYAMLAEEPRSLKTFAIQTIGSSLFRFVLSKDNGRLDRVPRETSIFISNLPLSNEIKEDILKILASRFFGIKRWVEKHSHLIPEGKVKIRRTEHLR